MRGLPLRVSGRRTRRREAVRASGKTRPRPGEHSRGRGRREGGFARDPARAVARGAFRVGRLSGPPLRADLQRRTETSGSGSTTDRSSSAPWAAMGQRPNAQGLDLNRDYMKLETPEARSLVRLFTEFDPHVTIDLHTTNGTYHGYHLDVLATAPSGHRQQRSSHWRRTSGCLR